MPYVTFLPKEVARNLKEAANVISVRGVHDSKLDFKVKHNRLLELFFNPFDCGSKPEQECTLEICDQIIDFVKECGKEDIIVHCGEGRIRSPAIAEAIEYISHELYETDAHYLTSKAFEGGLKSTASADRQLTRMIIRRFDARVKEEAAAVSEGGECTASA